MLYRPLGLLSGLAGLFLWSNAALAETRMALVIGNSSYQTVSVLPNPANDARAVTELLQAARFEVISATNLTLTDMRRAIRDFAEKVTQKGSDTVALIYFAGHGLQVEGENYLVPVDARIGAEPDVAIEAMRLGDVMAALAVTPSKTRIVILDACRNNPFSSINSTTGRGLAIVDAPTGSIVSYSTAPGMEALDGRGDNSPFTAALVAVAREPNLPIEQALKRIRLDVYKTTEGRQTPWESSSLTADFSFFGSAGAGQQTAPGAAPLGTGNLVSRQSKPVGFWRQELQSKPVLDAFELVIREDDWEGYEEFVALHAASAFAPRVRGMLERRREMITWYTAVTANNALAFQGFLDRYPNSDLAATARKLRDRAQARVQSANFASGLPGAGGPTPQTAPAAPASLPVVPASLPVALPCSCPQIPVRRTEPVRVAPPTRTIVRPPTDADVGRGPGGSGINIQIGIGGRGPVSGPSRGSGPSRVSTPSHPTTVPRRARPN